MENYLKTDPKNYFKSRGPTDLRLCDIAKKLEPNTLLKPETKNWIISGYPDDEGVSLNTGRIGAAKGPEAFRNIFYRSTPAFFSEQIFELYDAGNLNTKLNLAERHLQAKNFTLQNLKQNNYCIGIGGGHDYAYCEGAALIEQQMSLGKKCLIVNFDAHMDTRPYKNGSKTEYNSGTAFYRLLEDYPSQFYFLEIGIQAICNSKEHIQWAKNKGAMILSLEEIQSSSLNLSSLVQQKLNTILDRNISSFISVDLDAFSSSIAPGCSQSWPNGLEAKEFFQCLHLLQSKSDMRCLGVYELNPDLDQDNRTARLASQIVHHVLYYY